MAGLTVDSLAIAALIGFGTLLLISISLGVWIVRKAYAPPEPPKFPDLTKTTPSETSHDPQ